MTIYLKDTQLAKHLGVGRATIWRWIKEGQFPPPVRLSVRCSRWPLDKVEKWIRERSEKLI